MEKVPRSLDEISPLGVFLVKSGSKGDRLLFRYPYCLDEINESSSKRKRITPYALVIAEDCLSATRPVSCSEISDQKLVGFTDKVLSTLFAVKPELAGHKFELKVNDVRFVGHPTLLSPYMNRDTSSIFMFNMVFALKANASHAIVNCYHEFAHRLAIALLHEERRCNYLSTQAKMMLSKHDEVAAMPESESESPYRLILAKCGLAGYLKTAYEDLQNIGSVHLRIQNWIEVSFCLPHKVHHMHNEGLTIGPEEIQKCLSALRPYHGLLLLVEVADLLESLPHDTSPALIRLVHVASPLKNLRQLSADADLTLTQVFQLAGHLVYFAKATIVYPLCENNIYILSPNASTSLTSPLVEKFQERFPGASLLAVMSEFSLPVSLSQLSSPMHLPHQQLQQIQMVVWLLQHRLLMQLHTYVYLVTAAYPSSLLITSSISEYTRQQSLDDIAMSDVGSSVSSEECVISPSHSVPLSVQSLKSVSEEDLLERIPEDVIPLTNLTQSERECILKLPAANNSEDLKLFSKLCPYFKGQHHLEEVMYYENVRRSQLLTLLDKFRDVLITCQHEDAAVAVFYRRDN